MERIDCVVIGAGVVGLATARALAAQGREVVVLEAETGIGMGSSSRNSEVIHAGIYYPQGSLKARLCVAGKAMLYAFCEERGIAHRRCGKLIVATRQAQCAALQEIRQHAEANGVDDLRMLTSAEARRLEPDLSCEAALLSPSTGIIDSHAYLLTLQGDAEARGALFAFGSPVLGVELTADGLVLEVGGAQPSTCLARTVVNCAGLAAPALAAAIRGLPASYVPRAYYAKGNYFGLSGRAPFSRLIYPVPEPGGLGVHLTLDLGGRARFGPDVEWVTTIDYRVDPARAERFYDAIRAYWPALEDRALHADYAGIRPKIAGPGEPAADFRIEGPQVHGVKGLVNLFGIESPGLTAALAIADHVAALTQERA